MRKLTLQGYLKGYVRKMSMHNTCDIHRLAGEAKTNHRLREPLFLYAASAGKVGLLLKAAKDTELHGEYSKLAGLLNPADIEKALEGRSEVFGSGYHKVYRSYVSRRDVSKTDNRTKQLMHVKIVKLQASKNVSNYRLYSDLKLNGANVNAFLKHKATAKISLDNLRKMLNYLEGAPQK
jgi:hypothetical protein